MSENQKFIIAHDEAIKAFHNSMYERLEVVGCMFPAASAAILAVCIELNRTREALTKDKGRTQSEFQRGYSKALTDTKNLFDAADARKLNEDKHND